VSSPQDQQQAIKPRGQGQSAFQGQQDAIKQTFSSAPAASPVVSCPKGALTQQQAQERFDKFKCREDIPWDYPQDCCYNRAHVMATELQAEGVDVGKVWNYAPGANIRDRLRVAVPKAQDKREYVEWGYHVAPTVPVIDSKGTATRMVIDPSITKGPITPDEWKALQGQPRSKLVPSDSAPYFLSQEGTAYAGLDPKNPKRPINDEQVQAVFDAHRRKRDWNRL
jgi:hypothetical protein